MSAAATAWAWQQQVGKAKFLLVALADTANEYGEVRADLDTLAHAIEASRSTVIRHLDELVAMGVIEREAFKATNGTQLVSVTRLLMGASMNKPEYQNDTRPAENADFKGVSKRHSAKPAPEKAECQIDTHKGKDIYSLSLTSNTNNNYREALRAVDEAGLLDLWRRWVALGRLTRPTQEAQITTWAQWVKEGKADALRADAQEIIELGSYAHPFAGLKKKMSSRALNEHAQAPETGSAPPRPTFKPGQTVKFPDGSTAQVIAVLSRGIATDHPDHPDVPLGHLRTLQVIE